MNQDSNPLTIRKALGNVGWLTIEKFYCFAIGLPVSIAIARHLGPEQLGTFSFAIALLAILQPLTSLGLAGIVVRDLVDGRQDQDQTMGTAFSLQFLGAVLVILLSTMAIFVFRPDQSITQILVILISFKGVFSAINVIDCWFQSRLMSKPVAITRMIAVTISMFVKLWFVFIKAPLVAFAVAALFEFFLVGSGLLIVYQLNGQSILKWRLNTGRVKQLLCESWPLTVSAFAIVAQAYVDQIMLGQMIGDRDVGQYAVAVSLIGAVAFLPLIFSQSWAPLITAAKKKSESSYQRSLDKLYQLMFLLFLVQAVPLAIIARPLVTWLYGADFASAGSLLALLSLRLLFANYGLARGLFITNDSLFRYSMLTSMAGSLTNIAGNLILIPSFGAVGAIVATIVSFAVTIFAFDGFFIKTRMNFKLMIHSPVGACSVAMRRIGAWG